MTYIPSSYPASRSLEDNELRAVVNALDTNDDRVLQKDELNITRASLRRELDTNHNGRFESREVKQGLLNDRFEITLNRSAAVQVLLKFDSDQDGYLSKNEMEFNRSMMRLAEGHGKYSHSSENGAWVRDDNGNLRPTGRVAEDGRASISEVANLFADGLLKVGSRIKSGSF